MIKTEVLVTAWFGGSLIKLFNLLVIWFLSNQHMSIYSQDVVEKKKELIDTEVLKQLKDINIKDLN